MVVAILQARMSSKRLPKKVLMKILDKPILQYEIERVMLSKKIDKIVLATSKNKDDDALYEFATRVGIDCFRGSLDNVLERYYECALEYGADTVVRITGDCPVLDPVIIDEAVSLFESSDVDYVANTIDRTFPDGLDVEVFAFETLRKLYSEATLPQHLEHVTKYIIDNQDKFKITNLKNDIDYSYIRWTLDTIDDFYFFKHFYEKHNRVDFSWKDVLSLTSSADKYIIESNQTIRYAMKKFEEISMTRRESLYIVNGRKLVGTISDGDIRRALIYTDITNNDQIIKIANSDFHYIEKSKSYTQKELKNLLKYGFLPVLDSGMNLEGFKSIKELLARPNRVVLMAGGLGSRLGEITAETPKPMLKIAGRPILEIIVEQFKKFDFDKFYISVNHMSEQIVDYFENGSKFDVRISYLEEKEKLGTAGCLSLIDEELSEPFFVMNGDILTDIDFEEMLEFHDDNRYDITIGATQYAHQIPYGVIETSNEYGEIEEIHEKPSIEKWVSGGVYVINPKLVKYIPKNQRFDITTLFDIAFTNKMKVGMYKIEGYWMDIGRPNDFYSAQYDYVNKVMEN